MPKTQPIADGITWVGICDPTLRDFHGFATPEGTSYNSYLVQGGLKTALIDSVNEQYVEEMLAKVSTLTPLYLIDYIIINHTEPDHGGGIRKLVEALPKAQILCTAGAEKAIAEFHGTDIKVRVVGADDSIDLGGKTLQFLPMPMVHWPDSMFTYVAESATLLCNDAFGQHIGGDVSRWADEYGIEPTLDALDLYYANILMPLGMPISRAIEKVVEKGWALDVIAPSHGLAWRGEHVATVLERYRKHLANEHGDSTVVIYSSAWHSTELIAEEIAKRIKASGHVVEMYDLGTTPWSIVTKAVMDAKGVIFGSPTLHNSMFYPMAGFLHYISVLKPATKVVAAFGSYGWSSGATKQMRASLEGMGFEMPCSDLQIKYRPLSSDASEIDNWVAEVMNAIY